MKSACYFVSDAHLGISLSGHDGRQAHLLSFFDSFLADADALYIVGDLFDFWIEYRCAVRPDYFPVVCKLFSLVKSGVRVHYLAGNHDFALGPFLTDVVGVAIHHDHFETQIQGKKVHLYHGDGIVKADKGYRVLKKILRNPFNQRLYKLLHPDIGVPLASFFSGSSRKILADWITEEKREEYRQNARRLLETSDIVIFGHTHKPEIKKFGDKVYVNTGEWIRRYTYAKMENGEIKLFEWFPEKRAVEIKE
ncbi:MAG TPA: UDP-2,3-diacylglucosamine diphosphatase [Chitinivibrionales bacterium]|nr:UDP-2,3-diacylglucosamine diphosphatase [Chitinivibrionales bacterium]